MKKGAKTREMILERTAPLFNQQGYSGSSLATIMAATNLEKGGIYHHFESKEELALASFDYAFTKMQQRFRLFLRDKKQADERLYAVIEYFSQIVDDPPIAGGCLLLNTAIEADDAYPALRDRARDAMEQWFATIRRIVIKGIERHEFQPDVDADTVATLFISSLEGAVMLSKLYQNPIHMQRTAIYLRQYIQRDLQLPQPA